LFKRYLAWGNLENPLLSVTAVNEELAANQVYEFIKNVVISGDEQQMKNVTLMGGRWQIAATV
jgi:hypothetical protein